MQNTLSLEKNRRLPGFLTLLFFVEMWERFSYYGMRALLVLFLTSQLKLDDDNANHIYALFAAIGYSLPVIAGFLADKFLGFKNMVSIGGAVMILGHLILAFTGMEDRLIYLGLGVLAAGTAFFKGNITTLLGDCYAKGDPERDRGFTLFYVGVNLGALMGSITCGYMAHAFGWHYGFGTAGVGMVMGMIVFFRFKNILDGYTHTKTPKVTKKILGINLIVWTSLLVLALGCASTLMLIFHETFVRTLTFAGVTVFCVYLSVIVRSKAEERSNLIAISILIFFVMSFFAVEMQTGSFINLFTERHVSKEVFGIFIPAAVSQGLNPLSILLFGALMGSCFKFEKKRTSFMISIGLLCLSLSCLALYIGCLFASNNSVVGYGYLLLSMFLLGFGELCSVSIMQSQITALAPYHIKGFIMGIFTLSLAFSNLLGIPLAKLVSIPSNTQSAESLLIYQHGFFQITLATFGIFVLYLVFYRFINKAIVNN
ncbi:MFS transporter [Rickettsiales endosymbiont of Paramecium tredecaurelia]|uniref:peptide MFS transporter n=1 Tax=Candidatus Sarmatiella mevalonica TaxID=2770581 RepID=UPI0019248075|nr:oligopeptide:H+ symporter [Candidatus Sarmatiella mevalonica]MBL3284250.1 MFS transporter [Candidatus Sarmatiella mevalonica]